MVAYGVTCITALTVQSTRGVKRIDPIEGRIITEAIEKLMDDMEIAAVKIGMLGSAEAAKSVAAFLKRYYMRHVVLDPIIRSSSGAELITRDGLKMMKDRILGRVSVITPNIDEAAALTGLNVTTMAEMQLAAVRLHEMGARNVIITGGHLDPPHDLVSKEDRRSTVLEGTKIPCRLHAWYGLRFFDGAGVLAWQREMTCSEPPKPPSVMWKPACARRYRSARALARWFSSRLMLHFANY